MLEKIETPKGIYLAYRKKLRGKAAVDVLPDVLGGMLRGLSFPKLMHWDAMLEDGKGELLFGRPIRWILLHVRRPRGAVHDLAHASGPEFTSAGRQHGRVDVRPPFSDDQRPRGTIDQGAIV